MRKSCRRVGVFGLVAVLGLVVVEPAAAQLMVKGRPGGPGMGMGGPLPAPLGPGVNPATQFSGIKLIENSDYRRIVDAARAAVLDALLYEKQGKADMANRAWNDAIDAVQTVLDTKEDYYVEVRERQPNGQNTVRWASVKFEANNLLGSMPKQGLDVYEVRFGGKAKTLLDEAKAKGDRDILVDVANRYQHTQAGVEA